MYKIKFEQGLNNLPDAKILREKIFVDEQNFQEPFSSIDDSAYHLVIYKDNIPVAVGKTYPSTKCPTSFLIGSIGVLPEYRKSHLGQMILTNLEEKIKSLGGNEVIVNAQISAKGFYEKCGFASYGDYFYLENRPHIRMSKNL